MGLFRSDVEHSLWLSQRYRENSFQRGKFKIQTRLKALIIIINARIEIKLSILFNFCWRYTFVASQPCMPADAYTGKALTKESTH